MKKTSFWLRAVCAWNMLLCSALISASVGRGQTTNFWNNPGSGHWEDGTNWSLGIPPDPTQSVSMRNDGYKAVGIFPSTPIDFPSTMTVRDLTLFAIPGSFNTLLLNYSGTNTPLEVLTGCDIEENSRILNLYSAFKVDGELKLNLGQFHEEGGTLSVVGPAAVTSGELISFPIRALPPAKDFIAPESFNNCLNAEAAFRPVPREFNCSSQTVSPAIVSPTASSPN